MVAASFEAQNRKPFTTLVLRLNQEIVVTGFDAKTEKTVTTGFKAKPKKTVATDFEAKPEKIVPVVLRPNH
jgi:predicted sulfurtransferase